MKIKTMSFNIQHCLNFITREIDYDVMADTIKKCGADIIGLQEVRNEGESKEYEAQAKIIAEKLGFYYYFAEAIRFDGVNPYGNALISRYPITSAETILIPDPLIREYDGYYETRCLLKATIDVGRNLTILVSHFGLNPDNPILTPIQQKLYDTAECFASPKLSFPSDNPTVKIDYIFVSKDLAVDSADIPEIISSDHRPYIATIEL